MKHVMVVNTYRVVLALALFTSTIIASPPLAYAIDSGSVTGC